MSIGTGEADADAAADGDLGDVSGDAAPIRVGDPATVGMGTPGIADRSADVEQPNSASTQTAEPSALAAAAMSAITLPARESPGAVSHRDHTGHEQEPEGQYNASGGPRHEYRHEIQPETDGGNNPTGADLFQRDFALATLIVLVWQAFGRGHEMVQPQLGSACFRAADRFSRNAR